MLYYLKRNCQFLNIASYSFRYLIVKNKNKTVLPPQSQKNKTNAVTPDFLILLNSFLE